jgi:magnesium transporter
MRPWMKWLGEYQSATIWLCCGPTWPHRSTVPQVQIGGRPMAKRIAAAAPTMMTAMKSARRPMRRALAATRCLQSPVLRATPRDMLRLFGPDCPAKPIEPGSNAALPDQATWVDLFEPTHDEEKLAEKLIGRNIPTRAEMLEIEPSSRLYERDGVTVITMSVLSAAEGEKPTIDPVSFILTDKYLVTLRYIDPVPFLVFADHAYGDVKLVSDPLAALSGLLDAIIDRLADKLEELSTELEHVSEQVFDREPRESRRNPELRYEVLMLRIGAAQRLLAKIRESSVSATRMLGYLIATDRVADGSPEERHFRSLQGDARALSDHSDFLGENLNFLLDASLGMISLQQNLVMKIFSVVAVVLMPPTLIAGIYGMNFEHMPELPELWGYPASLIAMLASAILPYWYARRKGWL